MLRRLLPLLLVLLLASCNARSDLDSLQPGDSLRGFDVVNVYTGAADQILGARFIDPRSGFIVDLFTIESVPQGFFWVKTVPDADRGEAHACEHLLLGKGTRGRAVAALEDMSLASSSAWTSQLNTVYHFNTLAGEEGFYRQLEVRLDALLHPDFTDEEIRREVAHFAVAEDAATGALSLEEKGTVYTEMVSSYEGPGYPLWRTAVELLYGPDHPVANASGGNPDSMWTMTPTQMREFHSDFYRADGMGLIAGLPPAISPGSFLGHLSGLLLELAAPARATALAGMTAIDLPAPSPAAGGQTLLVPYASSNEEDRAQVTLSWPADLDLDPAETILLEVFLESLASGPGSPLYARFVDSRTREKDLAASYVYAYVNDDPGQFIQIGLGGMDAAQIDKATLSRLRDLVIREIQRIRDLPGGSDQLAEFQERARSHLTSSRKRVEKILNSPPGFGYRRSGQAGSWQSIIASLEKKSEFRKSLVFAEDFAQIGELLTGSSNHWRSAIGRWRLLERLPQAIAALPDEEVLAAALRNREQRRQAAIERFRVDYNQTATQAALAAYRDDFAARTATLDSIAACDIIPGFIEDPPLGVDEHLIYEEMQAASVPLVASTFSNMSSATLDLYFSMAALPDELLVTAPLLPDLLSDAGVMKDGVPIPSEEMRESLRSELLSFGAGFDLRPETGRAELRLSASAANADEIPALLGWLRSALLSPWLDEENLPRLRDLARQNLDSERRRMKGSEESWVENPTRAWLHREDALFLSAGSFLTRAHHLHRLFWLLSTGESGSRAWLEDAALLADAPRAQILDALATPLGGQLEELRLSLRASLAEIPDASLADDWRYLCRQTCEDLATPPQTALGFLREGLAKVIAADRVRLTLVSSEQLREAILPGLGELIEALPQTAGAVSAAAASLTGRPGLDPAAPFIGLLNENTRNGTVIFTAPDSGPLDTDPDAILNFLALRSHGGGGGHGMFMRTWAAGLAYSNGPGYSSLTGRVRYYAERCPDVAATLRFVAAEIAAGQIDAGLAEYSVAGAFGYSRSGGSYEMRGAAMARDLVDGYGPDRQEAWRKAVLLARDLEGLPAMLQDRLPKIYGRVLPGLGASGDGLFFLIGPEEQFEKLEDYLLELGQSGEVARLYPRDFWLRG